MRFFGVEALSKSGENVDEFIGDSINVVFAH